MKYVFSANNFKEMDQGALNVFLSSDILYFYDDIFTAHAMKSAIS
jgi:hypothetical protein